MVDLAIGGLIGIILGCLILGLVVGFLLTRWYFNKQLKENPPINEKMIRAMYMSMGRKPSEAQIRMTMNAMQNAADNKSKKKKKK